MQKTKIAVVGTIVLALLTGCSTSETQTAVDSKPRADATESELETDEIEGDLDSLDSESSEKEPEVYVTENQFKSALRNTVFTYDSVLGADIYSIAPFASGELVDGAGIGLQVVVLEDEHYLQLRILKGPTGDFDIKRLSVTAGESSTSFEFAESELFDAYIYEELTYEIGEMRMSEEDERFWLEILENEPSEWQLEGSNELVIGEFSKVDKSALATPIRVKQGLDAGYDIPEGFSKPLIP